MPFAVAFSRSCGERALVPAADSPVRWPRGASGSPRSRTPRAATTFRSSISSVQRLVQRRRPAGRQCDRHRPMRRGEVVDIDPVGGFGRLVAASSSRARTEPWMCAPFAPMAKMLKPRTAISVPKRIASCARGWSANSRSGASSRVVSKAQRRDVGLPVKAVRREWCGGLACGHHRLSWRARRRAANPRSRVSKTQDGICRSETHQSPAVPGVIPTALYDDPRAAGESSCRRRACRRRPGSASTSFPAVISKDVDGGPPPTTTITTDRRVNDFAAWY